MQKVWSTHTCLKLKIKKRSIWTHLIHGKSLPDPSLLYRLACYYVLNEDKLMARMLASNWGLSLSYRKMEDHLKELFKPTGWLSEQAAPSRYRYTCQIIALFIHCDEAMKIQKSLRWSNEFVMKKKNRFKLIFLPKSLNFFEK